MVPEAVEVSGAERGIKAVFGGHKKCGFLTIVVEPPRSLIESSSKNSLTCLFWDCNT